MYTCISLEHCCWLLCFSWILLVLMSNHYNIWCDAGCRLVLPIPFQLWLLTSLLQSSSQMGLINAFYLHLCIVLVSWIVTKWTKVCFGQMNWNCVDILLISSLLQRLVELLFFFSSFARRVCLIRDAVWMANESQGSTVFYTFTFIIYKRGEFLNKSVALDDWHFPLTISTKNNRTSETNEKEILFFFQEVKKTFLWLFSYTLKMNDKKKALLFLVFLISVQKKDFSFKGFVLIEFNFSFLSLSIEDSGGKGFFTFQEKVDANCSLNLYRFLFLPLPSFWELRNSRGLTKSPFRIKPISF